MSIVNPQTRTAKLYRYNLPMDSGVIVRDQRLLQREGYIVELTQGDNMAYGECAPLPGFSQESLDQVESELIEALQGWQHNGEWRDWNVMSPSVAFALSMAQCELDGLLPQQGEYRAAPLCSGDPDELIPIFETMSKDGRQKVAKVKVGLYEPIRDGMLVNLFLESIPDLQLRLDANRSWTLDKALKFAQYVSPEYRERITFLEEPCKTPELSRDFAQQTTINIAWDETVQQMDFNGFELSSLLGNYVEAVVIKPTLIGSIEHCLSLIDFAQKNGLQAVISSSIESTIGLTQLARLSAWKTPQQIPGLDTLQLFQAQLEITWPDSKLPVSMLAEQTLIKQFVD
ncbi:o-succinylbenzoate synthase [Vibrio algivorus]|uniref:o-succinylbenzoate synthase n=1 Tax=Vibrio algivorus TaxID=1667024 RepID=A0ABQ6ERU1_9VIBR|nr:o-succinylbenzoate synthase [Vibrio algivorus]GLT15756.1 o-succinylbenzoate synthase [Vibrio algivorus]